VCDDRHRVAGRHECAFAVDHIAVTIAITSRTERDVVSLDLLHERVCICQVRVGVSTTKVGERHTILHGGLRESELADEDGLCVWASNAIQAVKEDLVGRGGVEERLDQGEVKDLREKDGVVGNRVDNGDFGRAVNEVSDLGQVNLSSPRTCKSKFIRPKGWTKGELTGVSSMIL